VFTAATGASVYAVYRNYHGDPEAGE